MKSILVISPHMDDAVLSCCDYLVKEKNKGARIKVVTIFTDFKVKETTVDARKYMKKSGHNNIDTFQKARTTEDIKAMNFLDFEFEHWQYIDGGFRQSLGEKTYKNYNQLFSGKINTNDKELFGKIKKDIKKLTNKFDEIIIPIGIGNHADHLISKNCAESVFGKEKNLLYYVDWPYAYKAKNWSVKVFLKVIKNIKHISLTSKKKKFALKLYKSQVKLLFGKKPILYPEIISRYESKE